MNWNKARDEVLRRGTGTRRSRCWKTVALSKSMTRDDAYWSSKMDQGALQACPIPACVGCSEQMNNSMFFAFF